jgi:predicted RNase H-like nuclease
MISRNAVFDKICSSDISKMKGKGLKNHEDLLDAIICAYTAYYYWYWGNRKCKIFGDKENGYIVTPINDILRSQIDGSVSST